MGLQAFHIHLCCALLGKHKSSIVPSRELNCRLALIASTKGMGVFWGAKARDQKSKSDPAICWVLLQMASRLRTEHDLDTHTSIPLLVALRQHCEVSKNACMRLNSMSSAIVLASGRAPGACVSEGEEKKACGIARSDPEVLDPGRSNQGASAARTGYNGYKAPQKLWQLFCRALERHRVYILQTKIHQKSSVCAGCSSCFK